jgi:hypothetical protein
VRPAPTLRRSPDWISVRPATARDVRRDMLTITCCVRDEQGNYADRSERSP